MRIGLFTDQFSVGISGQTTSVMMLYNYFKKNGHACYIFTSHTHKLADDNPDIINLPGVPYPKKNMREYRFSLFVKRHIKLIEACRLDIIHVHTEHYLANVALAAKKQLGIPVVYTLHTSFRRASIWSGSAGRRKANGRMIKSYFCTSADCLPKKA